MPLYLLVLSLWPDGDNARRAAIREREVHMRLLSQKLTEAAQQVESSETDPNATISPEMTSDAVASAPTPAIPRNLGPKAEQYWKRVLSRGETIDWDEERAAQAELLGRAGGQADGAAEEEPMGLF
jgi:hypothetical protein